MRNFDGLHLAAEGFEADGFEAASSRMKGSGVSAASFGAWCFAECRVITLDQAASPVTIDKSNMTAIDEMAPQDPKPGAAKNVPLENIRYIPPESISYSAAAMRGDPTKPDSSQKRSTIPANPCSCA